MKNAVSQDVLSIGAPQLGFFMGVAKPDVFKFIRLVFNGLPHTLNMHLRETIILNYIEQAIQNVAKHGQLVARDTKMGSDLGLKQKLDQILFSRQRYYASPVLTAHPTEVFSDEVMVKIDQLVIMALKYRKTPVASELSLSLEKEMQSLIVQLSKKSFMPEDNLTPQQEMGRQDRLYLDMMESWSRFNSRYVRYFAKNHGVTVDEVKDILTVANKLSYQNVSSWVVADIDGNTKRTKKTMERMEAGLQLSIIDRYIERVLFLNNKIPGLHSVLSYLNRCRNAITDGIYFSQKGAAVAKKRLLTILQQLLEYNEFDKELEAKLIQLRDMVELVGFRGDLKQFVRESSKANASVFDNFVKILVQHFSQIQLMAQDYKHYADWPLEQKEKLHYLFRIDSVYFKKIKENEHLLTAESIRELEILEFVIEYQEQFSYILSDTEHYTSLNEVTLLFGYAAFRNNKLCIDDIRCPPVNLIPLCETPDDLANLTNIIDQMLSNAYLKQVIIKRGELIYVAGPSDLGREGGIFAHIELIEAEKNVRKILEAHQKMDANLASVQLRVLYGNGGDALRRVAYAFSQLFCTFQGSDACQLATYGSFQAYVEQVSGRPSENTARAMELARVEQDFPSYYKTLKNLVDVAVKGYRAFTYHPAALELFRQLSMPYQLGILTNTSSRGESKNSAPKDITKSRAIGIANYDVSSLLMLRIIMSADGLVEFVDAAKSQLPELYDMSFVVREQVLKIFYAIAVCDEKRALLKIFKEIPPKETLEHMALAFTDAQGEQTVEHALAYAICRIPKIIEALLSFLPQKLQQQARTYLLSQDKQESLSVLMLGILELLGKEDKIFSQLHAEIVNDLLPRFQRLKTCMDTYLDSRTHASAEELSVLEENVILALRGDKKIMAGPLTISKMSSQAPVELIHTHEKKHTSFLRAKL